MGMGGLVDMIWHSSSRLFIVSGVCTVTSLCLFLASYRRSKAREAAIGAAKEALPKEYEALLVACHVWEDYMERCEDEKKEKIKNILEHIYHALDEYDQDLRLSYPTSSVDSFVSAEEAEEDLDEGIFEDIIVDEDDQGTEFYEEGIKQGYVPVRTMQLDKVGCQSEEEYMAKVYCLRLAYDRLLKNKKISKWFQKSGRWLIERILIKANAELEGFHEAYDALMAYVTSKTCEQIGEELKCRRVVQGGFYDVALDYALMDSFSDLESPPAFVIAIMENKWLPLAMKNAALETATRTVLMAKQKALPSKGGYMSHMYRLAYYVSSSFAIGFLGPKDCELYEVCNAMKGL
eukprot:Ihof_evm10s96 gene=Ihof_evmTU10s96